MEPEPSWRDRRPRGATGAQSRTARAALIAGLVLLAATVFAALRIESVVEGNERERFEGRVAVAQLALERRLTAYTETLHGARSLFEVRASVTRTDWRRYLRSLDLDSRYPAIEVLTYNPIVPRDALGAYERAVRRDRSTTPAGHPEFRVSPGGTGPFAVVIDYIEPTGGRNAAAFGFDLMSDPVRRRAVLSARDSGRPVATGPIRLRQDRSPRTGFLLMLAVYEGEGVPPTTAARRRAATGFVVAVFHTETFMRDALARDSAGLDVTVREAGAGAAGAVVYRSHRGEDAEPGGPGKVDTLDVGGRPWSVTYANRSELVSGLERSLSTLVLIGGIAASLLVVALMLALGAARRRQPEADRSAAPRQDPASDERPVRSLVLALAGTRSGRVYAGAVLALAGVYLGTAKLGLAVASYGGSVTPVWAPTGLALAALVLLGRRFWPGVALGALAANLSTGVPVAAAAGIATGNTLEAVVGALLLTRIAAFRPGLARVRDVLALVGLGAGVATLLSASVGVASLWVAGVIPVGDIWGAWRLWWVGDALGAVLVAPAIMIAATRGHALRWTPGVISELGVLGGLAAIGLVGIAGGLRGLFVLVPLLVWAAFRFRQPGAVIANLSVATIGIWDALAPAGALGDNLLESQAFVGIAAVTSLMLAALAGELERVSGSLAASETARQAALDEGARVSRSEHKLAEAQAIAHVGSWQWDIPRDSVSWSDELYRIYGLEPQEFGASYDAFVAQVHPEDRARVEETIGRAYASGEPFSFEHRLVRPDGSIRFLHARGGVERGEDGKPARMVGTAQDITERRQAEREFRELLDSAPDAMVVVDDTGAIVLVNSQAETMFGYTRDELVGLPVERLIPERLRGRHVANRAAYHQSLEARPMGHGLELHGTRKDGHEFPVEISLSPLEFEGRVLVSSAIRDISERKAAQDALREAEERFRTAFEDAPVGMALLALDGEITQVNRALQTIMRYPAERLVGRRMAGLTHPSDNDTEAARMQDLATGRAESYQLEKRLIRENGEPVWVAVSASLVRDAAGRPRNLIAQFQDVTERRRFEGQLQFLADHDPLTQLINRRRFEEELDRLLRHVSRYRGSAALLMIDLDDFKDINDTLGHRTGDEVIRAVGRVLRERLRDSDVLARLGGDEFAVLLHAVDGRRAAAVADDLLDAIRGCSVPAGTGAVHLTASVGITMIDDSAQTTADDLLVEADLAMYEAKASGRNGRILYEPGGDHETAMRARLTWGERLRNAIEHDHFRLDCQPILDLRSGEVEQHELLIRLQLEDGRRIAPARFMPHAARFGLIREIDRWVLREAVGLLADPGRFGPAGRLAVNLSAQSVTDLELPSFLARELKDAGVDPGRLTLEITETDAIARMDEARLLVSEVAALGCRFALDDFGAGFGSFYYLKYLPFDYLKIDGEFIRDVVTSDTDRLIVKSLVDTARGLGMQTIAEYVVDEATVRVLRELGVDFAQGFHVGRPAEVARAPLPLRP